MSPRMLWARLSARALCLLALLVLLAPGASAQFKPRKIGELELRLSGLSAVAEPEKVTVPKNTASGVAVHVRAGATDLSLADAEALLGGAFVVEGDLSGPGLRAPLHLPETPGSDPFILNIPPLPQAGNYTLSNLRLTVNGATALDVTPHKVDVEVIDQVLITSVTTRPLTLDEIRAKGIILDNDSYLGFEFTLGLALDSKAVQFSFPVVFDSRGVAVPQPLLPAGEPERAQMPPLTTIVPMLLQPDDENGEMPQVRLPNGAMEDVRIPSVLVIPGNVGYLKQFFSAKLFVANGAPGASNLIVRDVTGTIKLPPGADKVAHTADDPLTLPDTTRGPQDFTQPVRGLGLDAEAGTSDDVSTFRPGEQGEVEFLLRGEKEGFHTIDFDVAATLDGLVTGPVTVKGSGSGGVLVRNPYFDMTFTAPSVVRRGESFKLYVTVNNISQALANDVRVTLDASRMSGAHLSGDATKTIDTLQPRDARVLEYDFVADRTGQVYATYLNLETDNGSTGTLKFTMGIGERGVPLSPDTLVLPAAVDSVPQGVVDAAMRVLGQAWSVANAPSGTLPQGVIRTTRSVVTQKALALAEAGLRVSLGQPQDDAVRDLLFDFWGGSPVDAGWDQILRTTNAGSELARAIGNALAQPVQLAGGAAGYERDSSQVAVSGSDFLAFGIGNGPVSVQLTDGSGKSSASDSFAHTFTNGSVAAAALVPFGTAANADRMVLVATPSAAPYTLELTGSGSGNVDLSVTLGTPDGFRRATTQVSVVSGGRYRVIADSDLTLDVDADGDGTFETSQPLSSTPMYPQGPRLISATVIGPETLDGAAPFGFQTAVLFDRIVDAATSANIANYAIANNKVLSAKRQLSGRLVFASLEQPEGPYVPSQLAVSNINDLRGVAGPARTVSLQSRLEDPGAVVTGRIMNADGSPLGNQALTYAQNPEILCAPPLGDYKGLTVVRTGGDGRYELRYVRQDQCGMAFQVMTTEPATGALRTVSSSVRIPGEQIVLDIALFGRGSVTGLVTDLSGNPVSGATVVALSQTDAQSHGSGMTDTQGRYRIDNLTVGAVTVHAVKGSSLGKSFGRIDRAGTAANVDITLDGGSVSAHGVVRRVQGSDIQPVPGLQVAYYVRGNDGSFIPVELATTGSDGSYAMAQLPAGEYKIEAALNQRDRGSATGIAAAGDALNKDIAIVIGGEGYGTVRGVVRFPDGTPAGGVVVSVDDRGVLTNADGSFELVGLIVKPTTSQQIRAQSRDGLRSGGTTVIISQPGQVISGVAITLSGMGSAEFTVLDANRQPVAGQQVALMGVCYNACGCRAQTTNAQGKVVFTNVPLGTVHARAVRVAAFIDQADASVSLTADGSTVEGVLIFPGSGVVSGTVLNPDGTPAMGADVKLQAKIFDEDSCSLTGGVAQRVRTDAQGRFRFTNVNVGAISVTASHAFFTTNVGASGTLTKNGDALDFTLKLVNTISGVLSGHVVLPDGVTSAGAGVEVTAVGPLPEVTVTTDANGGYEFAKIFPEGNYTLTARDAVTGGVYRESIYLKASQDVTRDLRLKGRGTVNVRVTDGAGQPVTNAYVRLEETDFPNNVYEAALQPSNGGVVTFDNVFEGRLTARASDAFARGGRASSTLSGPGATLDMTVALTTTGTVKGHFYQADGATPVPFGQIKLISNGVTIGSATTAGTDDVGSFSFTYVPAGSFRIEAQDPQSARSGIAAGSIATEGEVATVNVVAQGVGRVSGLVTSNGAPQPAAHVEIANGNFRINTFADGNGRYSIDGVPEGRITVTASLSANFLTGTNSGNLSGEGASLVLDVALRDSGSVTGHVLNAGGASPAPLSLVTINVGGTGGATLTATTDAAGAFSFERVPAGYATLDAEVLGGIDKGTTSADVRGSQTTDVTLTLNGAGAIAGRALDSGGQPIAGSITVTGTGAFPYSFTVQATADGNFALPQVLAGPFTAKLTAKSGEFVLYGTASGSVAPAATTQINVQVQPSGTVQGLVLRSDGTTPAIGASVVLQLDANRGSVTVQAGNDGRFLARGVPLGAFTVRVTDPVTTGLALAQGNLANNGDTIDLGTLVLDDQPIRVLSITPADGTMQVALTTPVVVTFSNRLQSASGISVRNGTSTIGTANVLSSDGKTATLTGTWPDSAELTVNVSTSVTDIFGRHPLETVTSAFRTIDTTGPKVVSVVPAAGAIQVAAAATIAVTFNEPLLATQDLTDVVLLDRGTTPITGTSALTTPTTIVFTPSSPLADNATYSVDVDGALDLSGNAQTQAFTSAFATNDTVAPLLTVSSPSPNSWITTLKPAIQVTASDATSGVAVNTGTLRIDGQPVAPQLSGATIYYTPASALAEGNHTIDATMDDRAGNRGSASSTFKLDATAPAVPSLNGISEGATLTGTATLGASSSDATSGVTRIELMYDGSIFMTVTPPSFAASYNTSSLPDGWHQFTARAVDVAGNTSATSAAVRALVNNRPLTLTFTAPAANTPVREVVSASVTVSEPVTAVQFDAAGQTIIDNSSPYDATFALASAGEGPLVITATATAASGETAQATRTVVVDRTAPVRPDASRITAEPPNNGSSLVYGYSNAVEPNATVEVTNTKNNAFATVRASSDGGFSVYIAGAIDDVLSIVAVDAVGNRSEAATVTIRQTPSLPPSEGSTTLHYDGILVDRVGTAAGALTPDGSLDAVFTVSLAIGDGVTRTISYIDLTGPSTRSTRSGQPPLGVAQDAGSPLLNNATGQINFPVTSGTTLTLFAANNGFIAEGWTYTVKAVFTDGSQFVGTYFLVPREDRTYVAHSADVTASPATVVVTGATPGLTTLTITNIRDVEGNLVPDGAKVALSAVDMASKNALGTAFRSAGGTITDGTPAANNASFRVFTISAGKVTATYSSAPISPAASIGAVAVVQVMAADDASNILGVEAISTIDINVRSSADKAIVHVAPASLYADRADRRSHVVVQVRDAAGNPVPDGTKVLLTAAGSASWTSCCGYVNSTGGSIVGGTASPTSSIYRYFSTSGGIVEADYSPAGLASNVGEVKNATIQVLPANADGSRAAMDVMGYAIISLVGAASTEVAVSPQTVPYVFPNPPAVQVDVHHAHDARAHLVPDGANLLVTATNNASWNACCYVGSAGGTISGGTASPSGSYYRFFPLFRNFFSTTWTQEGVSSVSTGQERTSTIQVLMGDNTGARQDMRLIGSADVKVLGPMNSRGSAEQSSIFGDGNLQTTNIRFEHILDTRGNPLPDGAMVLVTAANNATWNSCCYIGSAGGQILNGTASPNSEFKLFTIQNGGVDVVYGNQGIVSSPGQSKTANIVLAQSSANGSVLDRTALGAVPVSTIGTTTAQLSASPSAMFSDGADFRSTITIASIKDSLGRPVPDGTLIGVTAANNATWSSCCYIGSAGGVIIGDRVANESNFKIFPVVNGQIVLQYSSQGVVVTEGEKTVNVVAVSVNSSGNIVDHLALGVVTIRLLAPSSATVVGSPLNVTAFAPSVASQIIISNIKSSDGLPLPDGTKVGVTVGNNTAVSSCCYIGSAGGTITAAGTTAGDGTPATNNSNFKIFTIAGGQVQAVFDGASIGAGIDEVKTSNISVVPADRNGAVLTTRALGTGPVRINGTSSATAPAAINLKIPGTTSVTFTNIRDAAGNIVPDGTPVVATVANNATVGGCCYNNSIGGTITNGNASPSGTAWKWFTVQNGSVTIDYSTAGVTTSPSTARIQLTVGRPDGTYYVNRSLNGGVATLNLSY